MLYPLLHSRYSPLVMVLQVLVLSAALVVGASAATVIGRNGLSLDSSLLLTGRSVCDSFLPMDPFVPTSCQNTTVQTDLCCFNAPGGHMLQTQFWDYTSPLQWAGPTDSWTIHGERLTPLQFLQTL